MSSPQDEAPNLPRFTSHILRCIKGAWSAIRKYEPSLQQLPPSVPNSPSSKSISGSSYKKHSIGDMISFLVDNYNCTAPSDTIVVTSAWYGKKTDCASQHEFILILVEDKPEQLADVQPLINYLILDRTVTDIQAKGKKASTQPQTVILGSQPVDTFTLSYDGNADHLVEDCGLNPHRLLERLEFSPDNSPRLYELAVLAQIVSAQYPSYRVIDSNCYFFAGLIWDSLRKMYPDATHENAFKWERGKNGIYEVRTSELQIAATCESARKKISEAREKINRKKAEFEGSISHRVVNREQTATSSVHDPGPPT